MAWSKRLIQWEEGMSGSLIVQVGGFLGVWWVGGWVGGWIFGRWLGD